MKKIIILLTFLALTLAAKRKRVLNRPCPINVPVVQNYDLIKSSSGKWYEQLKTDNPHQKGGNCGYSEQTNVLSDSSVRVKSCTVDNGVENCQYVTISLAEPLASPRNGKLKLFFHDINLEVFSNVIAYEADEFGIFYDCTNMGTGKSAEHVMTMTRLETMNSTLTKNIEDIVDAFFNRNDFNFSNGKHCLKKNPLMDQKAVN